MELNSTTITPNSSTLNDQLKKLVDLQNKPIFNDSEWQTLDEIVSNSFTSKNSIIEDRPFEADDFINDIKKQEQLLNLLNSVFANHQTGESNSLTRCQLHCIHSIILLCGEHMYKNLWTSNSSILLSEQLLNTLIKITNHKNLNEFLVSTFSDRKIHAVYLFEVLSKKLSKEEWKYYPAAVICFKCLLLQIRMPFMKEIVCYALPLCLNIISNYELKDKVFGLELLYHIISNITTSELHWNIQVEVLQDILKRLLYYREAALIEPLIKCSLELINKSQFISKELDPKVDLKWSFIDEQLNIFLPLMEFETKMELRTAYIRCIGIILDVSNFALAKWTARLLRIFDDYSTVDSLEADTMILLKKYVILCWPIIKFHWRFINVIAGKVLYNSDNKVALLNAEDIIHILQKLLPNESIMNVNIIKRKRDEKVFS